MVAGCRGCLVMRPSLLEGRESLLLKSCTEEATPTRGNMVPTLTSCRGPCPPRSTFYWFRLGCPTVPHPI